MMRAFLLFLVLTLPLVSSDSDLDGCVTNIVTAVIPTTASSTIAALIDFVQCVVDGSIGQCQLGCLLDSSCAGGVPDDANQCVTECTSQCDDPTLLNSECLSTGVDLLAFTPWTYVQYLATLYQLFTSCVLGFGWAVQTAYDDATSPDPDVFETFCEALQAFVPFTDLGCSNIPTTPNTIVTAIAVAIATATATAAVTLSDNAVTVSSTVTDISTYAYAWIQSGPGTVSAIASATVYATAIASASIGDTTAYSSVTATGYMTAYVTATAAN
jgi:hypothetical protein